MGILYRLRQFGHTLLSKADPMGLDEARWRLSPQQWELFERLQPSERQHALRMLRRLLEQGERHPDLLVATLLHDVGKLRYPLNPLERAGIVLAGALIPQRARHWGDLPPGGWENVPVWRRAFVVAEQHAAWGAEMARQAGVSPLVESLIRAHHHLPGPDTGEVAGLQHKLWIVDNEN